MNKSLEIFLALWLFWGFFAPSLHGKAWWEVFSLVADAAELRDKRCSCFITLQRALGFGFQTAVKPEKVLPTRLPKDGPGRQ